MIRLDAIAAVGRNGEIGWKGDMPWKRGLKQDLKFFRKVTMKRPVIMGCNTWKSLPGLLPGRLHLVLTSHEIDREGVLTFSTVEDCLKWLDAYKKQNVHAPESIALDHGTVFEQPDAFVIGGASIYRAFLPYCSRLILTEIDADFEADTYFPDFDRNQYSRQVLDEQEDGSYHTRHVVWMRTTDPAGEE